MASTASCPHCGTPHVRSSSCARDKGTILGGMAGAAFMTLRMVGGSSPVLTAPLMVGALLGLLWGAKAGQTIGSSIDDIFPHRMRCNECGAYFVIG